MEIYPSDKTERFTQRARRVLSLAHEQAETFGHTYIGTEHLLLGIIEEKGSLGSRVLRELGLNTELIDEQFKKSIPTE